MSKKLLTTLTAVGVLALAPAAQAETQDVTGTTVDNSISVGVPVAATFGTALSSSASVTSTGGSVAITAVGPWTMTATGGGTSGNEGKLALVAGQTAIDGVTLICTKSSSVLASNLQTWATAALGNFTAGTSDGSTTYTSGSPATLNATAKTIASGTGSNTVTVNYKHTGSSSDQLEAGCQYSQTTTLTVA